MFTRSGVRSLVAALFSAFLMTACASYNGRGLLAGVATVRDVMAVMGEPALRWQDADGSQQLAYPRGPAGYHTYMGGGPVLVYAAEAVRAYEEFTAEKAPAVA